MLMMDEVRRPHDREGRDSAGRQIEDHAAAHHHASRPRSSASIEPTADLVPDMVHAGEGYSFHVTGLTHDERGYPSMTVETQDKLVRRLQDKLASRRQRIALCRSRGSGRCRSGGGLLRHHVARGAAGD